MHTINHFFAVILLGFAIWVLSRILPPSLIIALWGGLFIFISYLMGLFHVKRAGLFPRFGAIIFIYGLSLMVGGALGNKELMNPFDSRFWGKQTTHSLKANLPFQTITTLEDLQEILNLAKVENKPALIDFYADWCTSCKHMEQELFANPHFQNTLMSYVLVKVDLTKSSKELKQIMQHYRIIAPPVLLFFNKDGNELPEHRVVGEITNGEFETLLQSLQNT